MAFKHTSGNGKSSGVRVKNSYYTFSKEYPAGTVYQKKKPSKKELAAKRFKFIAVAIVFAAFVVAGYFGTSFLIGISKRPADSLNLNPQQVEIAEFPSEFRAYNFPSDKLNDTKYIKKFLDKMKWNDANAVIVDFKTEHGLTIYPSAYSVQAASAMFDTDTINKSLNRFKDKGYLIYAGVYCFKDNLAASENENMAVKFSESSVNWIDDKSEQWLNPYSGDVMKYLGGIIQEICGFEPDGIVLKNASFPNNGEIATASYPGEINESLRSSVLENFVNQIKQIAAVPTVVEVSASEVMSELDNTYYGAFNSFADGVIVNASVRPDGYSVDKSTQYISMISLINSIRNSVTNSFVLEFYADDCDKGFIKELKNLGYKKIIT